MPKMAERRMRMKYILIILLYIVTLPIMLVLEVIGTLFLCAATWIEALGLQMMAEDKTEVVNAMNSGKDVLRKKHHAFELIVDKAFYNRANELGCWDEIVKDLEQQ
jgi:hypothetical protein